MQTIGGVAAPDQNNRKADDLVWIPGGTFRMGSDKHYPEEAPAHRVSVDSFCIERGSHLCAPNYCRRYRPAARHAEPVDTSTGHVGFRCVMRVGR
jgi:formylglycine-generating enzyme required for sulfatase activity